MASKQRTTLYSPDGRKYETSDRAEVTRLKARGYREPKPAKQPKSEPKPDTSS